MRVARDRRLSIERSTRNFDKEIDRINRKEEIIVKQIEEFDRLIKMKKQRVRTSEKRVKIQEEARYKIREQKAMKERVSNAKHKVVKPRGSHEDRCFTKTSANNLAKNGGFLVNKHHITSSESDEYVAQIVGQSSGRLSIYEMYALATNPPLWDQYKQGLHTLDSIPPSTIRRTDQASYTFGKPCQ